MADRRGPLLPKWFPDLPLSTGVYNYTGHDGERRLLERDETRFPWFWKEFDTKVLDALLDHHICPLPQDRRGWEQWGWDQWNEACRNRPPSPGFWKTLTQSRAEAFEQADIDRLYRSRGNPCESLARVLWLYQRARPFLEKFAEEQAERAAVARRQRLEFEALTAHVRGQCVQNKSWKPAAGLPRDWLIMLATEDELYRPSIYEWHILNVGTYVGQARTPQRRLAGYQKRLITLLKGEECKAQEVERALATAIASKAKVTFRIIEHCEISKLKDREHYWIKQLGSLNVVGKAPL